MIPAVFHVNRLWSTRAGSPACHATFAIEKRPTLQDAKFHSQIRKNLSGGGNSVHSLMSDMPAYPSWTTLEKKRADVSCDSKRILQAMVRGGILRKSLESTKYDMQTARHSWPIPVYPLGFSLIWRGYYWDWRKKRDWSPSQTFQSQRDLCSSIHPCAMNMRLLGLCSFEQRNNQQGYNLHRFCEKWWQHVLSNKDGENMREADLPKQRNQKNQKQLQAIGYFRPPVLLLFLTKTGGTMRWALRLYQNRSRWLTDHLIRFCASHFSGCTRPGKNGVVGKIPWRRQWIDGF